MRRPAVPDVSVRAVARGPVGHGMRHRLCHFRDRRRVADEQAHRHDEHDYEQRVLDGCLSLRHVPTVRRHVRRVGGGQCREPCRICTPPLVGSGGGGSRTADRHQPRRARGGRRRAGARALRPDLLVHPARQGAADGVRRHGRPVRGALRGPLTSPPTTIATSGSSSTTSRRRARRRSARASRSSPTPGGASTSSTPGQPVPGRRLRRHPVRADGRRQAQAGHRGAREDPRSAASDLGARARLTDRFVCLSRAVRDARRPASPHRRR